MLLKNTGSPVTTEKPRNAAVPRDRSGPQLWRFVLDREVKSGVLEKSGDGFLSVNSSMITRQFSEVRSCIERKIVCKTDHTPALSDHFWE